MAANTSYRLTYADLLEQMDPDGEVTPVVELLAQRGVKELLGYLPWYPGNQPLGHQWSVRTSEPTAYTKDFGQFVAPSKSTTVKQTAGMSMIEAWSEVDADEIKVNGKREAFLAQENKSFISAIDKKFGQLWYAGNTRSDSTEFNGMATLLSTLASGNVIDCGGDNAATNTSIFVAQLGPEFFGSYPKGVQGAAPTYGWDHEPLGKQILTDTTGKKLLCEVTRFSLKCGLVLKNWQRLVRIANVKVADLRARTGTQAITAATNILYALSDAFEMFPDSNPEGQTVIIANRTVIACLKKIGMDRTQNVLSVEKGLTQFGRPFQQVMFLDTPIIPMDRIVNTESKVA